MPINLAELRKQAGLTQRAVARRMGRAQAIVCRLETRNLEKLRIGDVQSYCEAIGKIFILDIKDTAG